MKIIITTLTSLILAFNVIGQTKYSNDKYGFNCEAPSDWSVYAEIKDDPSSHSAIIDWGLPKVYSKLEKASIENAVSITAYKRSDIKNSDDLIKFELDRVSEILVSKEPIPNPTYPSYILISSRNGHKYKTKTVFVYKNNIGYVMNFTATLGTHDINLSKFDDFVKGIQFTEPKEQATKTTSATKVNTNGLYVIKTGEVNIPNNKITIYTYIKFCDNGTVYTQAVSAYDPQKVYSWLGKNGRFERKGNYKMDGNEISFTVTNDESPDKKLEGPMTDTFTGKMTDENKLFLKIKYNSGEVKDFWFEFVKGD